MLDHVGASRLQLIERQVPARLQVALERHELIGIGAGCKRLADFRDVDGDGRRNQLCLFLAAAKGRDFRATARTCGHHQRRQ